MTGGIFRQISANWTLFAELLLSHQQRNLPRHFRYVSFPLSLWRPVLDPMFGVIARPLNPGAKDFLFFFCPVYSIFGSVDMTFCHKILRTLKARESNAHTTHLRLFLLSHWQHHDERSGKARQ